MSKILILDHHKHLRLLYLHELQAEGYEVVVAAGAKDALEKLDQSKPDLVVMDIDLGRMGGRDVVAKIMDKMRGTPVILNTSFEAPEAQLMSWVADACVIKSSDLSELKRKIHDILSRNQRKEFGAYAEDAANPRDGQDTRCEDHVRI